MKSYIVFTGLLLIALASAQNCKKRCEDDQSCVDLGGPCTECKETRRGSKMCVPPTPCREECETDADCALSELCPECKPKKSGDGSVCQPGGNLKTGTTKPSPTLEFQVVHSKKIPI